MRFSTGGKDCFFTQSHCAVAFIVVIVDHHCCYNLSYDTPAKSASASIESSKKRVLCKKCRHRPSSLISSASVRVQNPTMRATGILRIFADIIVRHHRPPRPTPRSSDTNRSSSASSSVSPSSSRSRGSCPGPRRRSRVPRRTWR